MKRRQFTQTLALLTGGGALAAGAGVLTTSGMLRELAAVPSGLSRAFFEARRGEEFRVASAPLHRLILTAIQDASRDSPDQQFHVIFEGGSGTAIEEGTYCLEHGWVESLDLFLIPREPSGPTQRLTATINLLPAA